MSWFVQAAAQVPTHPLGTKKKPIQVNRHAQPAQNHIQGNTLRHPCTPPTPTPYNEVHFSSIYLQYFPAGTQTRQNS